MTDASRWARTARTVEPDPALGRGRRSPATSASAPSPTEAVAARSLGQSLDAQNRYSKCWSSTIIGRRYFT